MSSGTHPSGNRNTTVAAARLKDVTGPAPTPIACAASSIVAAAVPTSTNKPDASGGNPNRLAKVRSVQMTIAAVGRAIMPGDTILSTRNVPGSVVATNRWMCRLPAVGAHRPASNTASTEARSTGSSDITRTTRRLRMVSSTGFLMARPPRW